MKRVQKKNPWLVVVVVALAVVGALFITSEKPATTNPPVSVPVTFAPVQHLLHAQPKLPTIQIRVGSEEMIAEICDEPVEIATGMMFRTKMAENEAMIFIFSQPEPKSFYMRSPNSI